MKVIEARNPHEAFIKGVYELQRFGIPRDSRNGKVLVMPTPVTTVYEYPQERVIFWAERDANPFFHLYESLWMLAGRDIVEPLTRYVKRMLDFADDGVLHGAYGARWRHTFHVDQLRVIVERLKKDPNDRRCVLQMWDAKSDLDKNFRDIPCNTTASVQMSIEGKLDLTVFCRSNDIIWGAYGANAVQFSTLQEYLARSIGVPVGQYYQVSVNWHAYRNVFDSMILDLQRAQGEYNHAFNPYKSGVQATEMPKVSQGVLDMMIRNLVDLADTQFKYPLPTAACQWERIVYSVLRSHSIYKQSKNAAEALDSLAEVTYLGVQFDWVIAAKEWFTRRMNHKLDVTTNSDEKSQYTIKGFQAEELKHEDPQ